MHHHASNLNKVQARHIDRAALHILNNRRDDIRTKMTGMMTRSATLEINHTHCHLCGGRFSMRFEVEARGRTETAGVFLINMSCSHCQWDAAFYGYLHQDGRYGLFPRHVSADHFFSSHVDLPSHSDPTRPPAISPMPVSVAHGQNPYDVTCRALSRMVSAPVAGRRILLVPRAGSPMLPETGGSTHPAVIEATIDWLYENQAQSIAVAGSPDLGVASEKAFFSSLAKICRQKKARLVNIDHHPTLWIDIFDSLAIDRVMTTELLVDYDFIVSMPTLSTCGHGGVALSLDNLSALVTRHYKLHFHRHIRTGSATDDQYRERRIADLTRVLYPDLAIIDGMIGMEGNGPSQGHPKNAGLVIAGNNALHSDRVACELMGIDPAKIYLINQVARQSKDRGNHPDNETHKATVQPPNWKQWVTPFTLPGPALPVSSAAVTICNHNGCTSCQNALYQFLEHRYTALTPEREMLRFSIGPEGPQYPAGTVYVGNCAASRDSDHSGYHCNGCPPQAGQIWKKLRQVHAHHDTPGDKRPKDAPSEK